MTKAQQRDVAQALQAIAAGLPDMAARIVSAAIRSATRQKDEQELRAFAALHGLVRHPDFIA